MINNNPARERITFIFKELREREYSFLIIFTEPITFQGSYPVCDHCARNDHCAPLESWFYNHLRMVGIGKRIGMEGMGGHLRKGPGTTDENTN